MFCCQMFSWPAVPTLKYKTYFSVTVGTISVGTISINLSLLLYILCLKYDIKRIQIKAKHRKEADKYQDYECGSKTFILFQKVTACSVPTNTVGALCVGNSQSPYPAARMTQWIPHSGCCLRAERWLPYRKWIPRYTQSPLAHAAHFLK